AAVQVFSVGNICLGIITFVSRKNAVGADVNDSRAADLRDGRESMREEGIDGETGHRVMGFLQLLDDPNAVQNHFRFACPEGVDQMFFSTRIEIRDYTVFFKEAERAVDLDRLAQSYPNLVVFMKMPP